MEKNNITLILIFLLSFNLVSALSGVAVNTEVDRTIDGVSIPFPTEINITIGNQTINIINNFNQPLNTTNNVTFDNVTATGWFNGLFNWTTLTNWLSFDGATLSYNETKLNETGDNRWVNVDGDNMTGPLVINSTLDVEGNTTIIGDSFIVNATNTNFTGGLTTFTTSILVGLKERCNFAALPPDISCFVGGVLSIGVGSFATDFGTSLTGTLAPEHVALDTRLDATAFWNVTSKVFCDPSNNFTAQNKFDQMFFGFSLPVNYAGLIGEVTEVINDSCVFFEPLGISNETLVDATNIIYSVGNPAVFSAYASGAIISNVGPFTSLFKINIPNASGDSFVIDAIVQDDNTIISRIETDVKGQKSVENFRSFMETSEQVTSPTFVNLRIESDLQNFTNGSHILFDAILLNPGINMDIVGIKLPSNIKTLLQVGQEESASKIFYQNITVSNLTNQLNDSSTTNTLFDVNGSILYVGNEVNFTELSISLSLEASESTESLFFYCNSSNEWQQMDVSDGTLGFTRAGKIKFNNPINRGTCNILLNGSLMPDLNNFTYIAIQRTANIVNIPPVVKTIRIFAESSEWIVGNADGVTGADRAVGFVNEENQEEGGINEYSLARNALDELITSRVHQVGKNNSFSLWGNSLGVIPNYWGVENITDENGDIDFLNLTNYIHICNTFGPSLGVLCQFTADTRGREMPLLFTGDLEVWLSAVIHDGVTVFGGSIFALGGEHFDIFGGLLHIQTDTEVEVGLEIGEEVDLFDVDFEGLTISPFVQVSTGGGASEWTAVSSENCNDGACARAIGGALSPERIMQTNFSTVNFTNMSISFYVTTINLALTDLLNVTINNNTGSGFVELFSTSSVLSNVQQNISIPSTMENTPLVSLRYSFSANVLNEEAYIDDVILNASASSDTARNVTRGDANINFGRGTDGITYTGSTPDDVSEMNITADIINIIGNTTFLNVVEVSLNVTESIELNGTLITDFSEINANSSNFWDNLDTPSDILGSQINNDQNWINLSQIPDDSVELLSKTIDQISHGFVVGTAIYFNGSDYLKALANDSDTLGIGMISNVTNSSRFTFTQSGFIDNIGVKSLTAGSFYFVSESDSGNLTTIEGSNFSNPIFLATDSSEGYVLSWRASVISGIINGSQINNDLNWLNRTQIENESLNISGNVTADFFHGDGSQLTSISIDDNSTQIVYQNVTNFPTCTGNDKLVFNGSDIICETDQDSGGLWTENITAGNTWLVNTSMNVGIGTTSPNQNLEIFTSLGNSTIRLAESGSSWDIYQYIDAGREKLNFKNTGTGNNVLHLDYGGNVGIGTTSPSKKLEVVGGIEISAEASDNLEIAYNNGANEFNIFNQGAGPLRLGTSGITRMSILSGGNVGIGTISPGVRLSVEDNVASGFAADFFNDGNNANRYGIRVQAGADNSVGQTFYFDAFDGDGDFVGYLEQTAGSVFRLVDVSDERVKSNITISEIDGLNIMNNIPIKNYNKRASKIKVDGVIAQDVQAVFPDAVSEKDGILGVAKSELIIPMIKAIQELKAENDELKTRLDLIEQMLNVSIPEPEQTKIWTCQDKPEKTYEQNECQPKTDQRRCYYAVVFYHYCKTSWILQ